MIICKAENKIEEIKILHSQGMGGRKISKALGIPRSSLKYLCDKYGLKKQQPVKKYLELNNFQKSAIIGTLLGDSSISKKYCFNIGHSSKQEEYFNHKVSLFSQFELLLYKREHFDKRTNKVYISLQAYSQVFEEFKYYRNLFYRNNKKIIDNNILEKFNEVSLAYLFMDDGNNQKYNTTIALCNFDNESIMNIRIFLLKKWEIETTVTKQKSIRIKQSSIKKFFSLIRPYIIESMQYKLMFS